MHKKYLYIIDFSNIYLLKQSDSLGIKGAVKNLNFTFFYQLRSSP